MALSISIILAFVLGWIIGTMQGGIHVHKHEDYPSDGEVDYNQSMANELDPEVKSYLDKTDGHLHL